MYLLNINQVSEDFAEELLVLPMHTLVFHKELPLSAIRENVDCWWIMHNAGDLKIVRDFNVRRN